MTLNPAAAAPGNGGDPERLWDPELPAEDSDTQAWWDATRDRRLLVQRCEDCGHYQHYPRALCTSCGGTDLGFVDASGEFTLVSYSTVCRSPDPGRFEAPYHVALVQMAEGPTLFSRVHPITEPRIGQPMRLAWHPLSDGRHLPYFVQD